MIEKYICSESIAILQAMRMIDVNGHGILFLVGEDNKLSACVTDGDIRRYILAGGKTEDSVLNAANTIPKSSDSMQEAKALFDRQDYVAIPVLDNEGRIVDIYIGDDSQKSEKPSLRIPVVINAGGKGTRLDPFTKVLPKPLIPVGDIPIIEHIMREYQSYDCTDFHIIVNYKRELMKAYFADNEQGYSIKWYDEENPLGTGGGLSLLKGKLNDTFFFSNCDNLLKTDYESVLRFHKENGNAVTMICAYRTMTVPYGVVEIGMNGKIKKMEEKPTMPFLTNAGIYLVEPEVLEDIEDNVPIGFPDIVQKEIEKGRTVAAYPVSENDWMDMGRPEELEKMRIWLYGE